MTTFLYPSSVSPSDSFYILNFFIQIPITTIKHLVCPTGCVKSMQCVGSAVPCTFHQKSSAERQQSENGEIHDAIRGLFI